jgi:YD repeat-containing protein
MSGTENEPSSKYWAFVSYSHFDMRVAKWLTAALAKKRVPPAYRHLVEGSPANFAPLFRDEVEVSASSRLDSSIEAALRQSRNLIVVCSPFAVASEYVAQEIRYFISLGRADRILCLVASGVPNASDDGEPALECFPKPLRFRVDADGAQTDEPIPAAARPLAAVLGEETEGEQDRALRQLMAGLIGAGQRELDEHAERRKMIRRLALGGAAFAMIAIAFGVWDAVFREHETYYRSAVRRWGAWEGLGSLSASEAQRRSKTYKFVTIGWATRPSEVAIVNGSGACAEEAFVSITGDPPQSCGAYGSKFGLADDTRRGCSLKFGYKADGSIETEEQFDQFGKLIETLKFTGPDVATFVEAQFPCEEGRGKTGIAYVVFERYREGAVAGLDRTVRYLGKDRSPRPNGNGVYGARNEYDDSGWRRTGAVLGPTGEGAWADSDNIQLYRYVRDADNNATRVEYLNADGTFAHTKWGFGGRVSKYDRYGNEIERSFLSANNKPGGSEPALHPDGHAGWRSTFDERGNEIEVLLLGLRGTPVTVKFGNAGRLEEYDTRGNRVKRIYFDMNGTARQPVIVDTGYAGWTSRFDSQGLEIERTYLAADGKSPIATSKGYARWRATHDGSGNVLSKMWEDADGKPVMEKNGGYGWLNVVDEWGNLTETTIVDAAGNPTTTTAGIGTVAVSYDAHEKQLAISLMDDKRRPTLRTDHVAGYRLSGDDRGTRREKTYFGLDDTGQADGPTIQEDGCATIVSEFDVRGRETRNVCLDTARAPVFHTEGYASWRAAYDAQGRVTRKTFFGTDDQPVLINEGYAAVESTYDERGREVETLYLGLDLKTPIPNKNGVARVTRVHDDRGNVVAYWFRDGKDGKRPAQSNEGLGGWRGSYDNRGKILEQVWCDVDGQPTATSAKFSRVRYEYDTRGNRTKISYWDVTGKRRVMNPNDGYATTEYTYDVRGNETSIRQFDAEGRYIVGLRRHYDARDNKTGYDYIDAKGSPVLMPRAGYAGTRSEFDDRRNEIKSMYVDAKGAPVRSTEGIVGWLAKFDARRKRTERVFIDERGNPETRPDGIAILRAAYDVRGNRLKNMMLDAGGKPLTAGKAYGGYSGWAMIYDARDRLMEETYLGPDEKPVAIGGVCTTRKYTHDTRGNVATRACLDPTGLPMNDRRGVALEQHEYDERGRRTKTEYFNTRGAKVTPKGA